MRRGSLIDPVRRDAIRRAVEKGDKVFKAKGKAPPLPPDALQTSGPQLSLPPAQLIMTDPCQFRIGSRNYSANEYLVLAIQYNDLKAAKKAVDHGADVNHKIFMLPVSPDCTASHPAQFGDPSMGTPVKMAKMLGRWEIAKFLRENGASD